MMNTKYNSWENEEEATEIELTGVSSSAAVTLLGLLMLLAAFIYLIW